MYKKVILGIISLILSSAFILAQDTKPVAGIPVNYDESKVGDYRTGLPDPLIFNNGDPVANTSQWTDRREEIVKIFEENQFGKWPSTKPYLHFDVKEDIGLDGLAARKQISIYFSETDEMTYADLLLYLPVAKKEASPILLNISFCPNNYIVKDPGVRPGRSWDMETLTMQLAQPLSDDRLFIEMDDIIKKYLKEGFGFATFCYTDITPDFNDNNNKLGLRGIYHVKGTSTTSNEWGSISAWAFGVSCMVDYFEMDPDVDATRIALTGFSRLGKTALWTAARDPRIKVVMPGCSGEGGAALSRRNFGETVAHLTEDSRFPYWFCPQYHLWGDNLSEMPMDGHLLVSLIAPRPLLLQTGSTDRWSDPKGEWLSLIEARKVWQLYEQEVPLSDDFPLSEQPFYHRLGYVMHEGGHRVMQQDWDYYLEFMKRYL